ncbi:MAG: DsbA family protein [Humibacillus sp.]|nr:DsbA family protein [Humibacillus sp.]
MPTASSASPTATPPTATSGEHGTLGVSPNAAEKESGDASFDGSDAAPPTSTEPQNREDAVKALAKLARRTPGDPFAIGRVDAPVVMVSYSDFQCPFCGKFARDTEPGLIAKYVDAGVLRIEWRDFPYLGEESVTAAVAGRAAARQGEFWAFHDALFAQQQPANSGRLTPAFLASVAVKAGLDGAQLTQDMRDPALKDAAEKDFGEGQNSGVTGTPAFLINGEPVVGAQPAAVFERVIDQAAVAAR